MIDVVRGVARGWLFKRHALLPEKAIPIVHLGCDQGQDHADRLKRGTLPLAKAQAMTQTDNHASILFIMLKDQEQANQVASAMQTGNMP